VLTAGNSGRLSSCDNLDNTGNSDNSRAFRCMMQNMGENALLYFPNGVYDFATALDGNSIFRPDQDNDNRGIRCESRSGVLNMAGDHNNTVFIQESKGPVFGTSRSWNSGSGAMRGATQINVSNTNELSVGSWVRLYANRNGVQGASNRVYYAKVASMTAGRITIDRPLPDDFNGGGATVSPWYPAENLVLENCTVRLEHPDHQAGGLGWLWRFNSTAGGHIKNVHFSSTYQYHLLLRDVARLLIVRTDFSDMHWDKPFAGYSVWMANSSDVTFLDGHMEGAPQNVACGYGTLGLVLAFMDVRGPVSNQPAYDRQCVGGNCDQVDHGHPLHCSPHDYDLNGNNGDASCRGTRVDAMSGSLLFHNNGCSQTTILRSLLEGQVWVDFQGGPGRNNFFYGNTLARKAAVSSVGSQGEPGDYVVKREHNGNTPDGYRQNFVWANNTIGNFGLSGGFNRMSDGVIATDNVIRERCFYNNGRGENADGGACARITEGGHGPGTNDVFENNTVGERRHPASYSRTMPSAPGFSDWSMLEGADMSQAPFVGPEMGDPDSTPGCLPATRRWYGSCR
jgi:hypothetical protein